MRLPSGRVIIDQEFCKGCSLCIRICPREVLGLSNRFNSVGYYPAVVESAEKCNGCGFCAQVCPEVAISVYRE